MEAAKRVEGKKTDFAEVCANICRRYSKGVKTERKLKKREENCAIKDRHYHTQDPDDVLYKNIQMKALGLPSGKKKTAYNLCTMSARTKTSE